MNTFKQIANDWVQGLAVYEPGRPIEEVARELGFSDQDEIFKLASNENSLGPSPKAVAAMKKAIKGMHLYPDGGAFYLRKALSEKLQIHMEQILVGHGSNEIIELLGHVFLQKGQHIVMRQRAFVVYKLVASSFMSETIMVPEKGFTHDLDAMLAAITPQTRLVFISNPNNPTGTMVDGVAIEKFMERVPAHVVVVFDEAYIELLPPEQQPDTLQYVRQERNVMVLRTFSKTYGLAGLRVGYVAAPKEGIDLLHRVRQPFNVNAMALCAACAALEDEEHVRKTRAMVSGWPGLFCKAFGRMGLEYVPSVANFILVKVGRGREVFAALQKQRAIVRPMDGYGLPEYLRVTVGKPRENAHVVRALKQILKESRD